jgi:hypothetical protein
MPPGLDLLVGQYFWMFVTGVIYLLFKNSITEAVDGIMIFIGRDFDEDDIIMLDGKPGRIVRVGLWKTVFYLYDIKPDGTVSGGSKMVVQNSRLKSMKIEKRLPMLNVEDYIHIKKEK